MSDSHGATATNRARRRPRGWCLGVAALVAATSLGEPLVGVAPMPKLDPEGLRQLGPEHLLLVYCGAKAVVAQMPESRKRLDRLATDRDLRTLFDAKGKAETRDMLDRTEAEAKRLVKDAARTYREKTGKKIQDGPCRAYVAAIERPQGAVQTACHARYRLWLAEKLEAEVRGPAVASEFRERFRQQLAQELEQARAQATLADRAAKASDPSYDGSQCRFDRGIAYEPRRGGP